MPEARPRPWITYALIAANVVMFGVEIASGASPVTPTPQQIIELGGSYPPLTLNGEWWRLGASMFLHFGALHIALNMLCLYQARVVEQLYGRIGFLAIYLLAGLGGGIASLLVSGSNIVTAGASGAVFGVYGAFGAFLALRRAELDADSWRRTARSLAQFLVLNLVIGFAAAGISLSAHIGGVIVGFVTGAALLAGPSAARQRIARAAGLGALGVALTAVAMMSLHAAPVVPPVLARFEAVSRDTAARWNAATARAQRGELADRDLAALLERDVIPPYRAIREDLVATTEIPERLQPMFRLLDDYTAAQLVSWDKLDAALRQPDPEKQKPLLAEFTAHQAELERIRAAFEAELKRLNE